MDPTNDDEYETVSDEDYEIIEYVFEETGIDYAGVEYVNEGEAA